MSSAGSDIRETVEAFLAAEHPQAKCAFIAGAHRRAEQQQGSDIDLVVMYGMDYQTPHRNSYLFNGWPIEVFVQNVKAQDYFLAQDRARGMCVLASMISEGEVIGPDYVFAAMRQDHARAFIEAGPAPLEPSDIKRRIYILCDTLDDLHGQRPEGEILGCLAELYLRLGDLYLRAGGHWTGHSKQLIRRLKLANPELAARYVQAFSKAYKGDFRSLFTLANDILQPLGGTNWEGYYAAANEAWRG